MSNLPALERILTANDTIEKIIMEASLPKDEEAKKKVMSHALSILTELQRIERTTDKAKLGKTPVTATPESIKHCMLMAVKFGLPIDNRNLAYLDKRGNEALYRFGVNGFIYKIKEYYPDFQIDALPFFEGDVITIKNGKIDYELKNPFCSDYAKLQGFLVTMSYTDSGRIVDRFEVVTKKDLNNMKAASSASFVWKSWDIERPKTAAIKRAAKRLFNNHAALQEMIAYDNKFYNLSKIESNVGKPSAIKNIEAVIKSQSTTSGVIEQKEKNEVKQIKDYSYLYSKGKQIAESGVKSVVEWSQSLSQEEREAIKLSSWDKEFTKLAKEADSKTVEVLEDNIHII